MKIADLKINGGHVKAYNLANVPAGVIGSTIEAAFSPEWNGLLINATYTAGSGSGMITADRLQIDPDYPLEVPPEITVKSNRKMMVGFQGFKPGESRPIISTPMTFFGSVCDSTDPNKDPSTNPSLPVWQQIQAVIGNAKNLATKCKTNLVCAINEVKETAQSVFDKAEAGDFDGATFLPAVTPKPEGNELSWTNNKGEENPEPVLILNGKDGKDGITQDISGKQNWATVKLASFPEAETEDSLHAWANANHKGPDRKWLVESSNPDWAKLVASLGSVPDGVSPDDSAFILLEIPYSEAGPEMLEAKYILRNSMNIWNQTQYATYSTSTPTWHKSGWYRLDDSAKILEEAKEYADGKVVTIEIEDRGGQNFWTRPVTTAREIIDMVNAGKEVRLSFYDTLTNTGDQIYQYENTRVGVPYFRRNVITAGKVSRISWGVQYNGSIVAEEIPYDPAPTFVVTVAPGDTLTADKTFSEIKQAHTAGKVVSAELSGDHYVWKDINGGETRIRFNYIYVGTSSLKAYEKTLSFYDDGRIVEESRSTAEVPTKTSDLANDESYEKALTLKVDTKLEGVTSIETLRKFLYDQRKTTQRKAQFEISPGGVNAYLMDILGYPAGATADDKAFLYVELPYSEAGGFEIRYRYQLRDKPGIWDRTDYSTLDSKWKTTGWKKGTDISLGLTATAPGDLIKVKSVNASGVPTAWEKTSLDELEGKWELINEVTVGDAPAVVTIDADSNGKPFELSNAVLWVYVNSVFEKPFLCQIAKSNGAVCVKRIEKNVVNWRPDTHIILTCFKNKNRYVALNTTGATFENESSALEGFSPRDFAGVDSNLWPLTSAGTTNEAPAGTRFRLYGVRV